jgi:hypothetical protein
MMDDCILRQGARRGPDVLTDRDRSKDPSSGGEVPACGNGGAERDNSSAEIHLWDAGSGAEEGWDKM